MALPRDRALLDRLLVEHRPRAVVHFAAESHVDRSIHGPDDFVRTNVNGTFSLLEETRGDHALRGDEERPRKRNAVGLRDRKAADLGEVERRDEVRDLREVG